VEHDEPGREQRVEIYHGGEVAKRTGVPTAKSFGGVRLNKIGAWPNGYEIWREAMDYRVSRYRHLIL
jgi:hypothetical protein